MSSFDVTIAQGTDRRTGYGRAVQIFCAVADGQTINSSSFLSMATEVFLNGGRDPSNSGVPGFVYCEYEFRSMNGANETAVQINNKETIEHEVVCEYSYVLSAQTVELMKISRFVCQIP